MRPTSRGLVPKFVLSTGSRFVILLATAIVLAFGAAACGVQGGQEGLERAREVEKQAHESQQRLEKNLQEGYRRVEER